MAMNSSPYGYQKAGVANSNNRLAYEDMLMDYVHDPDFGVNRI